MWSFYLRFGVYATENWPFFWNLTTNLQSSLFFVYASLFFRSLSPYLLHITRDTCIKSKKSVLVIRIPDYVHPFSLEQKLESDRPTYFRRRGIN